MPAYQLVVSPAAQNDLKDIYQYGLRQWGQAQTNNYQEAIKGLFWSLTKQPHMGIERHDLFPDTRSLPVQSHTVFYRVLSNRVEIIRVLHSRQDPERHLK